MLDVLLAHSYFLRYDQKQVEKMRPYPPLATLYAASYLRSVGYSVALFDAMLAESEEEWAAALDRAQPRFAVLYEDNFNYLSKMCLLRMREAAERMIGMARDRGCTVIVGGSVVGVESSGNLRRALIITGSLAVSIIAFTLLLKASTVLIDIDPGVWPIVSGVILIVLGLVTYIPALTLWLPNLLLGK